MQLPNTAVLPDVFCRLTLYVTSYTLRILLVIFLHVLTLAISAQWQHSD
jgi:hypothetical protein